jgi:hypothetical protein
VGAERYTGCGGQAALRRCERGAGASQDQEFVCKIRSAIETTPPKEFASFLELDFATQQRWARELGVAVK